MQFFSDLCSIVFKYDDSYINEETNGDCKEIKKLTNEHVTEDGSQRHLLSHDWKASTSININKNVNDIILHLLH